MIDLTDIGPLLTNDFTLDYDYIDGISDSPRLYINGASEHYGDGLLEELARELHPHHTVLSHYPSAVCVFYPHWYHWAKQNWPEIYRSNIASDRKTHKISCLNNSARPHRILNWLELKDNQDILWSIHNDPAELAHDMELTDLEWQDWDSLRIKLPARTHNNRGTRVDADILHEAYTDSYVNFVTESTTCDKIFITEKTWKPIASGQLFVILGNQGIVKHLRDHGIDCFDDIIDHSYDAVEDPRERLFKLHESVNKLLKQDLYNINLLTKQRRTKNAELFWSNELYYEL